MKKLTSESNQNCLQNVPHLYKPHTRTWSKIRNQSINREARYMLLQQNWTDRMMDKSVIYGDRLNISLCCEVTNVTMFWSCHDVTMLFCCLKHQFSFTFSCGIKIITEYWLDRNFDTFTRNRLKPLKMLSTASHIPTVQSFINTSFYVKSVHCYFLY